MLTGESLPADKSRVRRRAMTARPAPTRPQLVFLGTSVVSGTGNGAGHRDGPEDDVRRHRGAIGKPRPRKRSSNTDCGDSVC